MERFCCNALEVYCFSALFRFLSSLQALRADGLLPQRVHCGYSTTPVLCLSCSLSVAFLPLSLLPEAWGSMAIAFEILHFIHTAKGPWRSGKALTKPSPAFSGLCGRGGESKWNAQSCPCVQASPAPCPAGGAGTGMPVERGEGPASPDAGAAGGVGTAPGLGSAGGTSKALVHKLTSRHRAWPNVQWGFPDAAVLPASCLPPWPR